MYYKYKEIEYSWGDTDKVLLFADDLDTCRIVVYPSGAIQYLSY